MEFLTNNEFKELSNPGVISLQLLSPHNSQSNRVTITQVTVEPGAIQKAHKHASSEQIWIAVSGHGDLLLEHDERKEIKGGEVVRFADGDTHGFHNTSSEPFVYISVTSPPINFNYAYKDSK
jgi:mannose-6-phosphate isomerase-like protein (cupin superfamily)